MDSVGGSAAMVLAGDVLAHNVARVRNGHSGTTAIPQRDWIISRKDGRGSNQAGARRIRGAEMTITVIGIPGPQGSKKLVGRDRKGRGILVESSAKVKPWREAVRWSALEAIERTGKRFKGALVVSMAFALPRPKSAKAGTQADKRPDLSKLVRSTEDALTDSGIWEDDARIVSLYATKCYAGGDLLAVPGCVIRIEAINAR